MKLLKKEALFCVCGEKTIVKIKETFCDRFGKEYVEKTLFDDYFTANKERETIILRQLKCLHGLDIYQD